MNGLIWTIIVGFLAGALAKFIMPGRDNFGWVMTILLGIAGSVVAGFLGQFLGIYQPGEGVGFIGSVIGALVILWVYGKFIANK